MIERIRIFEKLFDDLQSTNSRIEKDKIVAEFLSDYPDLKDDWTMILETLDGRHPIGWTFVPTPHVTLLNTQITSISDCIKWLERCIDRTDKACRGAEFFVGKDLGEFIAPIVNRTLRLGIGKSLLSKSDLTPMLAKKYDGSELRCNAVYVTEKLDGNRCLAYYDGDKWQFKSRNGKDMKVNFDMTGLPTEYIYDGEVMSAEQTTRSIDRCNAIINRRGKFLKTGDEQELFSKTSGIINSHAIQKDIVYNIFDIVSDLPYSSRREILDELGVLPSRVRVIPVLYVGRTTERINELLDKMCAMGGEGIMLNLANRPYEHKRTDALLKYKQVQYCDMRVIDVFEGKGKYEDMCGGLICNMITDDGQEITCEVGTGLSDQQRWDWGRDKTQIIGKIVEVGYHEITHLSSLRFPRLIRVRDDKEETSEY